MAAIDMFERYNAELTPKDRQALNPLIIATQRDLLAARSEDERLRLVNAYLDQARSSLRQPRRGGRAG